MIISDTTTILVIVPNIIDDILNDWIAQQRDRSLTKSVVMNLALREFLIGRGAMIPPGPLQQVDEAMRELVEKAFSDEKGSSD